MTESIETLVNQGATDPSLNLKRIKIVNIRTVTGQNMYTVEDEQGNRYEKRGYDIIVVKGAWYLC